MESVYLKTLVEVVRAGSISRAADTLCVTQPAVSRRIKFMEEQYGCPLLDRSGPRLTPTEAGALVYRKAETLLEIEADLVAGLHLLSGRTRISFTSTPSFGIAHLPAILRQFMLTCADTADLKFVFNMPNQIQQGLNEGRFDLAVTELCEGLDLSSCITVPLPDAEVVFVSAPSLGLPTPNAEIGTLIDVPLFTRREGCCSRTLLESNLEAVGQDLCNFRTLIVFDDLHVIVQAVLNGEGASFLSRDVVADHLASGRMVEHRIAGFQHSRRRAMVTSRSDYMAGALGKFVESLFAHFSLPMPGSVGATSGPRPVAASTRTPRRTGGRAPAVRPTAKSA